MRSDPKTRETAGSPFLDIPSFDVTPTAEVAVSQESAVPPSPFRAVYSNEAIEDGDDPETEEVVEFLFELYDREFGDALVEMSSEVEDLLGGTHGGGSHQARSRRVLLEQHLQPLTLEVDRLIDHLADAVEARGTAFEEEEIGGLVDGYAAESELSPAFEQFFGKLKKKLKKIAKKGAKLAKKGLKAAATLGFGPLIRKLKGKLGRILVKILEKAIRKLPVYLQPVARKLYKRYGKKLLREAEVEEDGEDAVADPGRMQLEFDQYLTYFVFADHEHEQDLVFAEIETEDSVGDPMEELHQARARFVAEISELEAEGDPQPAVERFLPAVWPLLKVGVKIAGRKRLLNTLSKHLAKLIRRFVGRRYAKPLSRAVVDLGLKYAKLEVNQDAAQGIGAEAVAYAVEDAARRMGQLPDHVLDNEDLLEAETVAAFETAAAAYLPDVLQDEVYRARPDLRESCERPGFWVGMPLGQPQKLYRKLTGGVAEVRACPHTLRKVRTWRGQTLASHLRNRSGADVGRGMTTEVHLYEVMAGGSLRDIARNDPELSGGGGVPAWQMLHPLTREAAGLLLREPGLGRDVPRRYLDQPARAPAVGQRFYAFRSTDAVPQLFVAPGGRPVLRQPSEVTLAFDFIRGRLSVDVFLSEARAQKTAAALRSGVAPVTLTTSLRSLVAAEITSAVTGGADHRVRILHPAIPPESADGRALDWLPGCVLSRFARALCNWVGAAIAKGVVSEAGDFVEASEDNADGVTLRLSFTHAPGLSKMRDALAGQPVRLRQDWFDGGQPEAALQTVAGKP